MFHLKDYSLFNNGGLAVTFFFVLSGFLISYLLMRERAATDTISIRKFYVRRILRIWPLYFFLVFLGTVLIPVTLNLINHPYEMPYTFSEVILYYVFFCPFVVNILFGHHLLEPLWSIGVEELFYIIWAPLFKFLKNNILGIIFGMIFLKTALSVWMLDYDPESFIWRVINMLEFEAMAIGGLAAYIIYHAERKVESSFLFSVPVQLFFYLIIILRVVAFRFLVDLHPVFDYLFTTPILSGMFMMVAFAWLIVNIALNSKSLLKLDNSVLNYLGEISYGVYMYHMIIIFGIVLLFMNMLNGLNSFVSSLLFYVMLTAGVIVTAGLSKKYFEDNFLKLKHRFSPIK